MAALLVRDVEPAIVARLKERADEHRCSVEDEHRAILRDVLLEGDRETPPLTFEAYCLRPAAVRRVRGTRQRARRNVANDRRRGVLEATRSRVRP